MTNQSVNEPASKINKIEEALLKTEALLKFGIETNLKGVSTFAMHGYLWTLSDIISAARKLV